MRLNLVTVFLAAFTAVYSAPLNVANNDFNPVADMRNDSTTTALPVQIRAPLPTLVPIKFGTNFAAPHGTWPFTSTKVDRTITAVLKEWLKTNSQSTNIKPDYKNVFDADMEEPYSFSIGAEVWPAKCKTSPPCVAYFTGNAWIIRKGYDTELFRISRSVEPSLFPTTNRDV
ncbi:hypothetical protein GGU10DRAFT_389015 [Lentinula aff. detonsa]|uniref:Uncharacterized protein n=1 Tax=Lentinula aff. detonsa TaxID=2804958 RepID=A0AA38L3G6_9AGAR|nr:hypothetical protein GGU10DRAFT_389015 [Lentinula aff. detonsa]